MLFPRDFAGADPEDVAWASGEVGKGVLLNVGVPNAAKTHALAKKAGLAGDAELMPNPWGGQAFMIADPDGYYLMVTDRFPDDGAARRRGGAKPARKGAKASARKSPKKAKGAKAKKGRR
jgi:hypothetical protein